VSALHLFIDTNIFLTFYAFANDDLEKLRKITGLMKHGKLKLYVTRQLVDEFYRNREAKLEESVKEFTKNSLGKAIPRYMADYLEVQDLKEAAASWQKARDALVARAKAEAQEKSLAADSLFAEIAQEAEPIPRSEKIVSKALQRRLAGNPPGKPTSLGDQIHWETLLDVVPEKTDLHIVSKDGDFASALISGRAKQYLIDEWRERKDANLILHDELRPFLNVMFPNIKLAVDIEKRSAMDSFIHSGFFQTHMQLLLHYNLTLMF
jgi:predicted nucleic acid-binding protein